MTDFNSTTDFADNSIDNFFSHTHSHSQANSNQPTDNTQVDDTEATATTSDDANPSENGFTALGLSGSLLKSIVATGYTTPTPIQARAIPAALAGRDLLLSAQTGSGKTAAFVLPILHQLSELQAKEKAAEKTASGKRGRQQPKVVQALILTPTRELANQVQDSIRKYGSAMKDLYSVPLVGGAAYSGQIRALKKGVQIIVATPGRLLDHINAQRVNLSDLTMLVLDEADRMLDMGFADDINAILEATPAHRQTIMSSATWDGPVGKIAESFTKDPERINIKVETAHIDEKVYFCDNFDHKNKLLEHLICDPERGQAIIFTATKRSSEEVAERLQQWEHKACYLHGDLPQSKRNRIVSDLRSGKFDIVVATDVAARGLDLPNITHVFNYDLPRQVEDYVHRIGRSGRAGRTGIAINLCSRDDRRQFGNIARYLKRDINEAQVEGLEPRFVEKFEGRGKPNGRDGRGRGRSGSDSRGGRDDRGSRSQRFGGSSERPSSERRFADKPRFDNQERYGKSASNDSSARFEKRERFDKGHQGNSDSRFGRDDASAPRRHRDSDNRHGNSQGDFHRAAKSSDKPNFDRDSRQGNREPRQGEYADRRRDDNRSFNKDGFKGYQGDKPRYNTDRNSSERHGERPNRFEKNDRFGDKPFAKKTDRSSEFRGDDRARKPRPIVEETFGQPLKKRSDRPYPAKEGQRAGDSRSNGFKSEGFKKSDKPFAGKSSRSEGFKSSSDRYASSSKPSAKPAGKQDGWDAPKRSRRNSTGKPL
ncbi:DEAD/DEAH box helicase [Moraxella sp. PS-22]|uniref:DEAD/DEAH box helicase n=1 Tax=Moraxella tetraodonis TaxID=2767221 RepID=A0A9X1URT9_9GAMM|nr:DEAD/DEAH box helicase [Moraxella tetraodonis]